MPGVSDEGGVTLAGERRATGAAVSRALAVAFPRDRRRAPGGTGIHVEEQRGIHPTEYGRYVPTGQVFVGYKLDYAVRVHTPDARRNALIGERVAAYAEVLRGKGYTVVEETANGEPFLVVARTGPDGQVIR